MTAKANYTDLDIKWPEWWQAVKDEVDEMLNIGFGVDDLPDITMVRDEYENGATVKECAETMIENWCREGDLPGEYMP